MYQNAKGVEQNHEKARYWWNKATEQYNENALKSLKFFDDMLEAENNLRRLIDE